MTILRRSPMRAANKGHTTPLYHRATLCIRILATELLHKRSVCNWARVQAQQCASEKWEGANQSRELMGRRKEWEP